MTREIKFREWSRGKYRSWEELGAFHMRVLNDGKGLFEQYTGLKDKNGVEIYEGDIISASVCGFTENGIVEYSEFCEWVFGNIRLNDVMSSLIVIGNIHENADLLEK